jgi:hypothetical protein
VKSELGSKPNFWPRQLAIIKNPHVAIEDHTLKLVLFFDTAISEGHQALQCVELPEFDIPGLKLDVSALEGKPCWVEVSNSFIKFAGWWRE